MDRQTMIVMCGLPRSGKSTYVDRHFPNYQIACPDDIRLGLGTEFNPYIEDYVWSVNNTIIRAHLMRRYNVVVDATNTTIGSIEKYKRMADEEYYRFLIILMRTTKEECLRRNVGPGSVPVEVIERMDRQLNEMIDSEFLKKYEVKYDHEYS